jgi:hypothetical protein
MSRSMVGAACGLLIIAASGCFHVASKLPGVLDLRSDGGDCVVDIRIVRIKKAPLAGKPAKVDDDDVRPSTKTAAAQRF